MGTMSKTLLAVLVGILVGGAAYVMAAPADKSSSPAIPAAATTSTTSTVDVSGPWRRGRARQRSALCGTAAARGQRADHHDGCRPRPRCRRRQPR